MAESETWQLSGWQLSGWQLSGWQLSGWQNQRHGSCQVGRIRDMAVVRLPESESQLFPPGASSGEFTLWNGLTFNFETILQAHDSPVRGHGHTLIIYQQFLKISQIPPNMFGSLSLQVRTMQWSHNDVWMVTGDHSGYIKYCALYTTLFTVTYLTNK